MSDSTIDPERQRLLDADRGAAPWRRFGPYLSERQWGTVREDYSEDGEAWDYFTYDMARWRAYRWGEDGIGGFSDDQQRLCFALALWNGQDSHLKERLFGVTNTDGNHGEDVKEQYYFTDGTPTHSYMRMVYKYPQAAFPYDELVAESRRRSKAEPEYELVDTGVFEDGRYFDVDIEYAKRDTDDFYCRITACNRGPVPAKLHLLPTVWFRNTWSWDRDPSPRPRIWQRSEGQLRCEHPELGDYRVFFEHSPSLLFCHNETNEWLESRTGSQRGFKDAFHRAVVDGDRRALCPELEGTKAAAHATFEVDPGECATMRIRVMPFVPRRGPAKPFEGADEIFAARREEATAFYAPLEDPLPTDDARAVHRQALAGLLWSKQFYYYDLRKWLDGDAVNRRTEDQRKTARNRDWEHLLNADVISMPDTWEYPWYAAWDLAFHAVAFARIDPAFAKEQLRLMVGQSYMHPNGQMPAYEWHFDNVNPPVHAWAVWRVFDEERRHTGEGDFRFLEGVFHKLMLNFTWWVNRQDDRGRNVFQGGFLGLDNIGVFDRSRPLPTGGHIDQADGTAWMAMFCLNLMRIALELARRNDVYEEIASKFFEHFLYIAKAMGRTGERDLWDHRDQFYYDVLRLEDADGTSSTIPLRLRSMVGLIPLFAVEVLEPELLEALPRFKARVEWFYDNRPDLASLVSRWYDPGRGERHLLSLLRGSRMKRLLWRMLDEREFLSDYGVRALSKVYEAHPFRFETDGEVYEVSYQPAESDSYMFGGNSNWRGPIWIPVNYLIVESLRRFHRYYTDDFTVECPSRSGNMLTIAEVADEVANRLSRLFLRDAKGRRPINGADPLHDTDPHFRDYVLFYEYFHGDTGRGVGANHQTGWSALVAHFLGHATESD